MGLGEKAAQVTGSCYTSQGEMWGKEGAAISHFFCKNVPCLYLEIWGGEAGPSGYAGLHASFAIHVWNFRTQLLWETVCEISQGKVTLG